jgi:hypothetical protein
VSTRGLFTYKTKFGRTTQKSVGRKKIEGLNFLSSRHKIRFVWFRVNTPLMKSPFRPQRFGTNFSPQNYGRHKISTNNLSDNNGGKVLNSEEQISSCMYKCHPQITACPKIVRWKWIELVGRDFA